VAAPKGEGIRIGIGMLSKKQKKHLLSLKKIVELLDWLLLWFY
jgi:hypothetical protein